MASSPDLHFALQPNSLSLTIFAFSAFTRQEVSDQIETLARALESERESSSNTPFQDMGSAPVLHHSATKVIGNAALHVVVRKMAVRV